VVSVPDDCAHAKMRTCRYVIDDVVDGASDEPIEAGGLALVQNDNDREAIAGALGVANIEFDYVDADGEDSWRDFDPDEIRGDNVIGYDRQRQAIRQFNLGRISNVCAFDSHRLPEDAR